MTKKQTAIVTIISCCVAAMIAVAATVLIIYGVKTHQEDGLLQVDWTMGLANYAPAPGMGEDLVWPRKQIPITLNATTEDGTLLARNSEACQEISRAIKGSNEEARCPLLISACGNELASATVIWGVSLESGRNTPAGLVTHQRLSNGELRATLRIAEISSTELMYATLLHENFHLIGLRHDDFRSSLMFPTIPEVLPNDVLNRPHLTDSDRNLLQEMYCN